MKASLTGLLSILMTATYGFGQSANIAVARFHSPQGPYVELYTQVNGRSITPVIGADSLATGAVDVLLTFSKDGQVANFDKFRLQSPPNKGARVIDFIDQKRYALPDGTYEMSIELTDVNKPERVKKYESSVHIEFTNNTLEQSDIQLLAKISQSSDEADPFVKSGVHMEPMPYNFYGRGANMLAFYHEIYGSDAHLGIPFVVSYEVQKKEQNQEYKTVLIGHKKLEPAAVNPLLVQMDISSLESGSYRLNIAVRNKERVAISNKFIDFDRSNPLLDVLSVEEALTKVDLSKEFVTSLSAEEIEYSLRAIFPLLPNRDVESVDLMIREHKVEAQRMYLYSFWAKEDRANTAQTYQKYMEVARAIDLQFDSGFRHGFETDRGYVYLKYGRPDDMVRNENEPSAPPYEIWSYNSVPRTGQNNVRFIFYNPSLAADDFILLHSDVIGERQNPQWEVDLYRDSTSELPEDNISGDRMPENIGRNARRLLTDY